MGQKRLREQRTPRPGLKSWPSDGGFPAGERVDAIIASLAPRDAALVHAFIDRRRHLAQKDEAIRSAATLVAGSSISGKAKSLEGELRRYLGGPWSRERHVASLPVGASPLRRELHRIAHLTGGDGMSWRRILQAIEA
jgi:hypothetical protein